MIRHFNPWRWLKSQPDVTLEWAPSLPDVSRYYPEFESILMRTDLSQVVRRCSVAHELAHRELGHRKCRNRYSHTRQERDAEVFAARMMIEVESLCIVLPWASSIDEAAEELWVDLPMLQARLERLTTLEQAALTAAHQMKGELA